MVAELIELGIATELDLNLEGCEHYFETKEFHNQTPMFDGSLAIVHSGISSVVLAYTHSR